jgi:hypothetical protein
MGTPLLLYVEMAESDIERVIAAVRGLFRG